jgi:hypothetical protein
MQARESLQKLHRHGSFDADEEAGFPQNEEARRRPAN